MDIQEQDAAYLRANHKEQSAYEMAKALGRGPATVYKWMKELGLKTRPRREENTNHPWRVQNRRLEAMIIENRQLKTGRKR